MSETALGGRRKVPNGWCLVTLDEVKANDPDACRAGPFGSSISRKYFVESGIPVIRGNNLCIDLKEFIAEDFVFVSEQRARDKYKNCLVKSGDLVFTCWGTIGQVGRIPSDGTFDEYVISNKQLKLRTNPDVADSKFVYYYLASEAGVEYIKSRSIGAAVPGINLGIMKSIPIALPPLAVQKSIVEKISTYDDLIENNRRRIQLLEQAARLLHKEWFVHLRFPGHEHVKIKDGVPEGWEKKTIKEVAPFQYGKALKKGNRVPGPFPVYGSSGIVGNHESALVKGPAIIVGRKGNVGSVFWSETDFHPIDTVYFIETKHCSIYLYYALLETQFINTDVAVPGLNRDFAHSRKILVPERKILLQFEQDIGLLRTQIHTLTKYNESLAQARDLLLPRLMNGEVAV